MDDEAGAHDRLNSPDAPPPLSPARATSPVPPPKDNPPAKAPVEQPKKDEGAEPGSWLNTIDESDSDDAPSVHSGGHGQRRRKNLGNGQVKDVTDFDTAFDEAVEAAYEDEYEPDQGDEEQQMMDDIAKDYMDQNFNFNVKSKSSLPRESASSGYTRSTWQSSVNPDRNTAATTLSTLSEDSGPGGVLPRHQPQSSTSTSQSIDDTVTMDATTPIGGPILDRRNRLSGASLKPLSIETAAAPPIQGRRRAPSSASRVTTGSQRDLEVTPWEVKDNEVTPWEADEKAAEVTPWDTMTKRQAHADGKSKEAREGGVDAEPWLRSLRFWQLSTWRHFLPTIAIPPQPKVLTQSARRDVRERPTHADPYISDLLLALHTP